MNDPEASDPFETDSMKNESINDDSINNESIESIIASIPLRTPSQECDEHVMAAIGMHSRSPAKPRLQSANFLVATAAALLIGFCLGTMVKLNLENSDDGHTLHDLSSETSDAFSGFGLSENVKIKNGESKTFIVGDSLQFQNNQPVRKLETVTRKKVLVRNQDDESETEIEIPIRKVFLTPAETI